MYMCALMCYTRLWFVILQGNMFAVTLYDTVYLYLKLASQILNKSGSPSDITDGSLMHLRAKNSYTKSSKCYYSRYSAVIVNRQ